MHLLEGTESLTQILTMDLVAKKVQRTWKKACNLKIMLSFSGKSRSSWTNHAELHSAPWKYCIFTDVCVYTILFAQRAFNQHLPLPALDPSTPTSISWLRIYSTSSASPSQNLLSRLGSLPWAPRGLWTSLIWLTEQGQCDFPTTVSLERAKDISALFITLPPGLGTWQGANQDLLNESRRTTSNWVIMT